MWGMIITQSRNLVRMASTWTTDCTTPAGLAGLDRLVQVTWACSRSLCNKLSGQVDDEVYEQELRQVFNKQDDPTDFVNRLLKAPDKCHASLMELSLVLDNLPDIDLMKRVEIDKSLVHIGNCIGACERIFSAPVPLVYTRHTARFLSVWLLLLPLAMYDEFTTGWELIPASAMISIFLFGIEELAVQLEEPFSILPMQRFCDSILQTCSGFRDWTVERKRIIIKTLE
jgi:predicted membrane chloride channel (bestrophin family)